MTHGVFEGASNRPVQTGLVHITNKIVVEGSDAAEHNESSVIQGASGEG
jgi:hypothetical protein